MKQAFFLVVFALLAWPARADYGYLSLSELVCEADYAAVGRIVRVDKNYFYLKVEKYLFDNLEVDTLKLLRFENWNCGRRHAPYHTGQRELVFFKKSNYAITQFEWIGYGAGFEFELPIEADSIYYHSSYSRLTPYQLDSFLQALRDFNQIRQELKKGSPPISESQKARFGSRSSLHRQLLHCDESRYRKKKAGFTGKIPEPRIYFGSFYRDSISSYSESVPRAYHYLDHLNVDRRLNYELLSYSYEIQNGARVETYTLKSEWGTIEFHVRLRKLRPGDRITVRNVLVLYPDGSVHRLRGRTVYVRK